MIKKKCTTDGRTGFTMIEVLVTIAIASMLLVMLLPAIQVARERARSVDCLSRLQQVGVAIHNFEAAHRVLPSNQYKPWSVEILPQLEGTTIYKKYQPAVGLLSEPNLTLGATQLGQFQYPSVGQRTVGWNGLAAADYAMSLDTAGRPLSFSDGLSATAIALESSNAGLGWLEGPTLLLSTTESRASHHSAFHVLFADGSVKKLKKEISATVLDAMRTPNGHELNVWE